MNFGVAATADRLPPRTSTARRWAIRAVKTLAVGYPLALLGLACALRCVGERWWVTAIVLYVPRLVFVIPLPFAVVGLLCLGLTRWLATQVAAALLWLFVLMGFVVPWPRPARRNAPVLRILSYNINGGSGGVGNVVEQIDAYSPDTVLLQEIGHPEDFQRLLKSRYAEVHTTDQFILATRYPVVSSFEEPDKIPYLGRRRSPRFVRYVIDTPLGHIALYNVHPRSPREALNAVRGNGLRREILSGRLFRGGAADVVYENVDVRTSQVEKISDSASRETDPVVIAGDTNLPSLSNLFGRRLSGYVDGFRSVGWGFGYSFPSDLPWMRIDRILATRELRFVRFEVGDSTASDHRCVVAEIQRFEP
jgi:endonuclease/exonuclease/phosphatase (EEP) superfamily protein YafD